MSHIVHPKKYIYYMSHFDIGRVTYIYITLLTQCDLVWNAVFIVYIVDVSFILNCGVIFCINVEC